MGSRLQKRRRWDGRGCSSADSWRWGLSLAVVLVSSLAVAAGGPSPAPNPAQGNSAQAAEAVDMFAAIQDGRIEVQLIVKDSTQCRVNIQNKTDQPLTLKLPEAFAGVPVLAQRNGGGGGGGNNRNGGNSGRNQGVGGGMSGGMGGMMGGMGGMGGGGGFGMGMMNIPPEKVEHLTVPIVCLEHGKHDPNPNVPYEIQPIDQFTDKGGVREVCAMLGSRNLPQRVAQVAAWHLNNDMSWQELAAKELQSANGSRRPYFSPAEVRAAMQVSTVATAAAEQHKKTDPPKSDYRTSPSPATLPNDAVTQNY